MPEWVQVAKKEEIPLDTGKKVTVGDKEIALFQCEGKVYAISAVCPHQGGPLDEGGIHGEICMCPWHGWEFNVKTGVCNFNDEIKIPKYEVREDRGDIYVRT